MIPTPKQKNMNKLRKDKKEPTGFSKVKKSEIRKLFALSGRFARRIKELNPDRYVDAEKIEDDIDDFLNWVEENDL